MMMMMMIFNLLKIICYLHSKLIVSHRMLQGSAAFLKITTSSVSRFDRDALSISRYVYMFFSSYFPSQLIFD